MSADAAVLLIVTLTLVWGGLGVSVALLARRPEREDLPHGGEDGSAGDA